VEGYLNTGNTLLTAEFRPPEGAVLDYDRVKCNFIAAKCGWQPTPQERENTETCFPYIIHCEWSITQNVTPNYNCIAWSVGITDRWMNPTIYDVILGEYVEEQWVEGVHYISIDKRYGNNDNAFDIEDDMDPFYYYTALYEPIAVDQTDAKAIYYDGYHGAKRKDGCTCGAGKWVMFESKCGDGPRIEHVYNQLDGSTIGYGTRCRYYK